MALTTLELVCRQIQSARDYTWSLLADIEDDLWFAQPTEGVTHVAWQVGHLAMAQYGLCLFRMRGRCPEDTTLMSGRFRKHFSKGSTPHPDPTQNPTPTEIREVLHRVHRQAMTELPRYSELQLEESVDEPFMMFPNKLGGLYFCAAHEMLHAGQIGLLRRLLGKVNIR
jgi:hypothetical protein